MKKIIVASKNPVKFNAALAGFQRMFPEGSGNVIDRAQAYTNAVVYALVPFKNKNLYF